jgi:acetolactate synthase small subunit
MAKTIRPTVKIHDLETGEVIERELNDAELKAHNEQLAQIQAEKEAEEAKATARAEILNRLGITADEAAILLG